MIFYTCKETEILQDSSLFLFSCCLNAAIIKHKQLPIDNKLLNYYVNICVFIFFVHLIHFFPIYLMKKAL